MANRKKAKGTGGQAARQRQQQDAASRRHRPGTTAAGGQGQAPASAKQPVPAQDAPAAERWYLDVSAVRIQEWLARTPALVFRRGASVLLSAATEERAWAARLPAGTEWNDEAGDIDGVVSLRLAGTAEGPVADTARQAASEVIRAMRDQMPCLHVQAVLGHGPTYTRAYRAMKHDRQDGTLLLDSPPAPNELILAKPCDQCRSAPAAPRQAERDPDLCAECVHRWRAGGGTKGTRRSPRPERELLRVLGPPVRDLADDFGQLAAGGRLRRDDAASQVALVYADGNRVGDFIDQLSQALEGTAGTSDIARLIDEATTGALADAVRDRFPGWERPALIAHLAGGDDLLISVPAADAWQFTRVLLASFGTRTGKIAPPGIRPPTLSAALVFAHRSHPFSDLVRIAGQELHTAKSATRGAQAAVSFRDLTADGGEPPAHRRPLTASYLDEHAARLAAIEDIPPSRRQALLALLRQGAVDDAVRRLTDFADNRPLWEVIAGPGATPEQVRANLTNRDEDEEKRAELRQLLDIARHWRTHPRQEPS
jgi:hypothetical protein